MIKIAHEAPKSIFETVQEMTDYDYALVHLFEEDKEYLEIFKNAVAKGREVILDNSIFELGEAFSMPKFAEWINKLKPTWYIVPDSLENFEVTKSNMQKWLADWKDSVTGKVIGVIQGKTYEEIVECYRYMDKEANVDKIAIPFDLSLYQEMFPHPNKLVSWTFGRVMLVNKLLREGVINKNKAHHLLGCALPVEGKFYNSEDHSFIDSMDTSNPVVHGITRDLYMPGYGLNHKASVKLYTMINDTLTETQRDFAIRNIGMFRDMWNYNYYTSLE